MIRRTFLKALALLPLTSKTTKETTTKEEEFKVKQRVKVVRGEKSLNSLKQYYKRCGVANQKIETFYKGTIVRKVHSTSQYCKDLDKTKQIIKEKNKLFFIRREDTGNVTLLSNDDKMIKI
jgi:hypothetical protein